MADKYYPTNTNLKPSCPRCGSYHTIKNVSVHNGKLKNQCKNCGRQFVIHLPQQSVSDDTQELISKLLLEHISWRGIVKVTRVSLSWLQSYVNNKLSEFPYEVSVLEKARRKLIIDCDALRQLVYCNQNKFYA